MFWDTCSCRNVSSVKVWEEANAILIMKRFQQTIEVVGKRMGRGSQQSVLHIGEGYVRRI